jgi:hypothetical protein
MKLRFITLSVIILSVIMVSVMVLIANRAECYGTVCRYAECHYT